MRMRPGGAPFVGRSPELHRLERAWQAAATGRPQLVLVAGEAGIGKSRLARELAARVRAGGGGVLLGECLDLREGGLPYGPVRQALRDLRASGDDLAPAGIRSDAADVLAALLPALDHGAADGAALARVRLFESLLALFQRLAEHRPLLLIIDDVHWADHATLDLLTFLARNLSTAPVMELLTFRDDEVRPDAPLLGFLQGHGSGTVSDHLDLARFGEDEVAAQIAELLSDEPAPTLIREIFERSDGNPLFVEELVAHRAGAVPDIPPGLDALLSRRIGGVDPRAQRVLRVASVAGHEVTYEVLRAVVDLDEGEFHAGLRAAIDARLLRVDPTDDHYVFRHALLQEAIRDQLLPSERRALHRTYAETLTRMQGDEPALAGTIAWHWDQAGEPAPALAAYVAAAAVAERSYAYADAERCLERASRLWEEVDDPHALASLDKVELLSRAVDAAVLMEEPERGVPFARAALRELEGSGDTSRIVRMQAQLARTLWYAGAVDDGLTASREALASPQAPSHGAAFAYAKRASQLAVLGRLSEALALSDTAMRMAEATGAWWTRLSASITHASLVGRLESVDTGLALLDDAAAEARRRGIANDLMRSYLYRGRVLRAAARWDDAHACYTDGMAEAPKYGMDRRYVWRFQVLAARVLFLRGRWTDAAALIAQAREHGSRAVLPELALAVGDFDAVDRFLAGERSKWRSDGSGRLQQPEIAVELTVWRGELAAARERCERMRRVLLDQSEEPLPLARLCLAGLRATADLGATTDPRGAAAGELAAGATTLMGHLEQLAREHPVRGDGYGRELDAIRATGAAEHARLARAGDPAPWRAALSACERVALPYPAAYAHLRLGEALAAAGERQQAAAHLRAAGAAAAELGAVPLHRLVAASAREGGVVLDTPPGAAADGAFATWAAHHQLTDREQQVVRLLARGLSNREIAERLFIAEGTASVHVSRILRKLDVRTRAEVIHVVFAAGVLDGTTTTESGGGRSPDAT